MFRSYVIAKCTIKNACVITFSRITVEANRTAVIVFAILSHVLLLLLLCFVFDQAVFTPLIVARSQRRKRVSPPSP